MIFKNKAFLFFILKIQETNNNLELNNISKANNISESIVEEISDFKGNESSSTPPLSLSTS